jgi:type IV pilus assembly protein PilV
MQNLKVRDGFSLVEVLIAMFIFSIGILAIANLQYRSILHNKSAFDRTQANAIASTIFEELKRLSFNDGNLTEVNGDLDAGRASAGTDPDPSLADHVFDPALLPVLNSSYQVDGNNIIDGTGRRYQLFWNVQHDVAVGTAGTPAPFCTIKLFMYWSTPLGRNHLEMTAVKYNNQKVSL